MMPSDPPSSRDSDYAVDWAHRADAVGDVLGEIARQDARQRRRRLGLVGAAAVLLFVGGLVFRSSRPTAQVSTIPPAAIVSLPARQILPDGSVVELKEGAAIDVAFTANSSAPRRVNLLSGEAHFSVAKNKERPFIVAAGGIEVRAVGTAFSVDRSQTQVEVVVTEGRVAVDDPREKPVNGNRSPAPHGLAVSGETIATVDAGNHIVVPVSNSAGSRLVSVPVEPLSRHEMEERMAWRLPKLEFSGTPLSEAVAMFNQNNEAKFVLADSELGRLQVSGFLRADKTETFILLLETDFGIKAERRGANEILLHRP